MNEQGMSTSARRRRASTAVGETTETEFLDAAERQFAENGYAGAKIRAIADEARANLGALHYYWGSKESLFRAACRRRMAPMIEELTARFDTLGRAPGSIDDILQAYFEPCFLAYRGDAAKRKLFCRTYARILTDPAPEVRAIVADMFSELTERFVRLLRIACDHIDDTTFYWRLHCVFGVCQHAAGYGDDIRSLANGRFDMPDLECGLARMVQFMAAGLKAPAT